MSPRSQGCSAVNESMATMEVTCPDRVLRWPADGRCHGPEAVSRASRGCYEERSAAGPGGADRGGRYPVPGHRRGGSADRRRAGSFRVRGRRYTRPSAIWPPSDLHGTAAFRRHVAGVLVGASYRAVAGVLSPWRSKRLRKRDRHALPAPRARGLTDHASVPDQRRGRSIPSRRRQIVRCAPRRTRAVTLTRTLRSRTVAS